jgi:hypothetical protein
MLEFRSESNDKQDTQCGNSPGLVSLCVAAVGDSEIESDALKNEGRRKKLGKMIN